MSCDKGAADSGDLPLHISRATLLAKFLGKRFEPWTSELGPLIFGPLTMVLGVRRFTQYVIGFGACFDVLVVLNYVFFCFWALGGISGGACGHLGDH